LPAHNWWQVKTALESNGWREVLVYEDKMLYFALGGKTIGFEKSNNMSVAYTKTLLRKFGLDYESFVASNSHDRTK